MTILLDLSVSIKIIFYFTYNMLWHGIHMIFHKRGRVLQGFQVFGVVMYSVIYGAKQHKLKNIS